MCFWCQLIIPDNFCFHYHGQISFYNFSNTEFCTDARTDARTPENPYIEVGRAHLKTFDMTKLAAWWILIIFDFSEFPSNPTKIPKKLLISCEKFHSNVINSSTQLVSTTQKSNQISVNNHLTPFWTRFLICLRFCSHWHQLSGILTYIVMCSMIF